MRIYLNIEKSLIATNHQNAAGMIKIWEDLDRYERVIMTARPDVIIECGTNTGMSALWFVERVSHVITIDIVDRVTPFTKKLWGSRVTQLLGNCLDQSVTDLIAGKTVMVSLDCNHHADHVRQEITHFGSLVTPGQYLIVEDGIAEWMITEDYPSPLVAIEDLLESNSDWSRDEEIEQLHTITMHPAGWWKRS